MQTAIDKVSSGIDESIQPEFAGIVDFCKVSKFRIKNSCFFVVSLEAENSAFLTNTPKNSSVSILGHFEFGNERYAIIYAHENSDCNLTKLLTERELQITNLIALGWTNKQVANQLQISEWTVSAHLRRIFIKLNVDSRTAMVYKCASLINQQM